MLQDISYQDTISYEHNIKRKILREALTLINVFVCRSYIARKPLIFFESLYQGVMPNLGYIKKGGRYSYLCDRLAPALSRGFHVDDCGVTEDILFSPYFELYNVS